MKNDGIEIMDYTGAGYASVMHYEAWRVAVINYSERFDEKNLMRLERHLLTDEVFVLLDGEAVLVSDTCRYQMERFKIYNVKKGTWHAVALNKAAKVLIVENDDTGRENSEYKIAEMVM